jgi:hypothetical protein
MTCSKARPGAAGMIAIAVLAASLAAGAAWAQAPAGEEEAPPRVGRLADVGGEVYHAPEDRATDWSTIGQNYPIATGDNLWVAEGGRAEIDVGVAQIRLGGETNVHMARLDDRTVALFVAQGQAILRLRVLEPGEVARIDTPNTQVVLTRPGLYRVDVSPDRSRTSVIVREGEATLPTQGGMQQVLPGQTATAEGLDATYVDVRHGVTTDGFDTWSANRDRRYERSRSAQYVSRQMVGYADLDDYGRWENDATYGAVWYPTLGVDADWAPYRNGYWTTVGVYGPTWVDYAPWGYAPFHYGRWVYTTGRWGWCPGRYIARPYWAPALVGWVGGVGLMTGYGGPIYSWAPLAWGEPYKPWWGNCGYRCWTHYNRPYSVNLNEHNFRAPPQRYLNVSRPGGVTAVGSATFTGQKPVRANLVPVSPSQATPVAMSVPAVRSVPSQKPLITPGQANTPRPASTVYTSRRDPVGVRPGSGNVTSVPVPRDARPAPSRDYPVSAPSTYATPNVKPSPSQPSSAPPPTRYSAPVQRETAQPYAPPQRATPAPSGPSVPPPTRYTAPVQRETAQPYVPPQRAVQAPPQRAQPPQQYQAPPQRAVQPQPYQAPPQRVAPQPPAQAQPAPQPQRAAPQPPPQAVQQQPSAPQPSGGRGSYNDGGGRQGGGGDGGAGPKPGQRGPAR